MSRFFAASGTATEPPPIDFPIEWTITRHGGNPLFTVTGGEPLEMYTPAPIMLPSGEIVVYVKGNARIYGWHSTDGGATFSFLAGGAGLLNPVAATWEANFVVDPMALYDEDTDTIHVWYKARDAGLSNWAWGHATAPGSDPTDFTKDAGNPILTSNAVETDLSSTNITDLSTGCVVQGPDDVFHFYGYALYDGIYHLIQGTGTDFDDPGDFEAILDAPDMTDLVVQCPDVVQVPDVDPPLYLMFYARGEAQPGERTVRVATSADLVTWDFSNTDDILSPTGTGWEEDEAYCGHFLKESTTGWLLPDVDGSGRWRYFYSGLGDSKGQGGIAYFDPT